MRLHHFLTGVIRRHGEKVLCVQRTYGPRLKIHRISLQGTWNVLESTGSRADQMGGEVIVGALLHRGWTGTVFPRSKSPPPERSMVVIRQRRMNSKHRIAPGRRSRPKPRRCAVPKRLRWRENLVTSQLYGRCRYLHEQNRESESGAE